MKNKANLTNVLNRLEENDLKHQILELQNGSKAIITERGGKVLGPFLDDNSSSIFWINDSFTSKEDFKRFLDSDDSWTFGGERMWIAPEIQYRTTNRSDFWNNIILPEDLEPGKYKLDLIKNNHIRLKEDISLTAYGQTPGQKTLNIERSFLPVDDPLRFRNDHDSLIKDIRFIGYEHRVDISEVKTDEILSEAWILLQVNSGGKMIIPITSPDIDYSDYFDPVGDYQEINNNFISLNISGDKQYKVGYNSASVLGRIGYLNKFDDNNFCLIVRNFFNNPSSIYCEEPPDIIGKKGNSVHVYNDNGMFGGFGEIECNGQTLGGNSNRSSSKDDMCVWIYLGEEKKISKIAKLLLGYS